MLSTAAFIAFGLFSLPAGWLADNWSRRNMIVRLFPRHWALLRAGRRVERFETLAVALFGVGMFAAIYHPVGTPMVVDAAVRRGRTMAFNGICGNVGVSIASGCTAVISLRVWMEVRSFSPRPFSSPVGRRVFDFCAGRWRQRVVQAPDQDVALGKSLTVAVVAMFFLLAFWVGLVFNAITIMLPKLVGQHVRHLSSPRPVCWRPRSFCAAAWRNSPWAARSTLDAAPHHVADRRLQMIGILLAIYTSGWWLLPRLALAVAAIYGQVTVNDWCWPVIHRLLARAHLFDPLFPIFTMAGRPPWGSAGSMIMAVSMCVLGDGSVIAVIGALNTFVISVLVTGAENRRAQAIHQRAVVQPAE